MTNSRPRRPPNVPVSFTASGRTTAPTFDNSKQVARLRYRFNSYATIARRAIAQGVSFRSLFATKFPRWLPDQDRPSSLSIELTDACNLQCDYCTNPLFARPRTYMSTETFERLCADVVRLHLPRVRVGGGEATLHPKFEDFSAALAKHVPFMSIVTNAQWRNRHTIETLVDHYDLIEVSVDAGGQAVYEASRHGASFERLESNLEELVRVRAMRGSTALINIRLMLRPSTQHLTRIETRRWSAIADAVMPQYVIEQRFDDTADVFAPPQVDTRVVPTCTLPFKDLFVRSNGEIPMCQVNGTDLDADQRVIVGNVKTTGLRDAWMSDDMRELRRAHRRRRKPSPTLAPCRGCSGR